MVSHPENGSDSPIGSDRDRGRDTGPLFWAVMEGRGYYMEPITLLGRRVEYYAHFFIPINR